VGIDRLNLDPILGASELVDYFSASLDAGATQLTAMWRLSEDHTRGGAVTQAIHQLLATRPAMPLDALRSLLQVALKHLSAGPLRVLAEAALADPAIVNGQRTIWNLVEFLLDPVRHGERFVTEHTALDIAELFDEWLMNGLIEAFHEFDSGTRVHWEATVVRLLGCTSSPEDELVSGLVTREARLSGAVRRAITWLTNHPHPDAGAAVTRLIADPGLAAWHTSLRHARAEQARLQRDRNFKHPTPSAIRIAVDGGPPVNAADLRVVVSEELNRLRAELRTDDGTPWKDYWNLNSHGNVTKPLIENQCRNRLLARLRDRLKPYRIAAVLPEAQRGEETRVDMLMLTGAGRNLPVEVKRHYHRDIWTGASTQLQGYAAADGADGYGVYLVFWFGNEASPTPARPDGGDGPKSARELETMLVADLAADLRAHTDVIVFDVSNPDVAATAAPRRKRRSNGAQIPAAPYTDLSCG
jgi:hypothetical protein